MVYLAWWTTTVCITWKLAEGVSIPFVKSSFSVVESLHCWPRAPVQSSISWSEFRETLDRSCGSSAAHDTTPALSYIYLSIALEPLPVMHGWALLIPEVCVLALVYSVHLIDQTSFASVRAIFALSVVASSTSPRTHASSSSSSSRGGR